MLITKREEGTKQGFCKILWRKLRLRGRLLLVLIQFQSHCHLSLWGGVGAYLSLIGRGRSGGGRLFEAGRGLQGDSLVLHNTSLTARLLYATMITFPWVKSCCSWNSFHFPSSSAKWSLRRRQRLASIGGQGTVSWLQTVVVTQPTIVKSW